MLTTIAQSKDPLITGCLTRRSDPNFLSWNDFPLDKMPLLDAEIKFTSETLSISKRSFNFQVKILLHQKHTNYWKNSLDHLQVQSKFKDIACVSRPTEYGKSLCYALLPSVFDVKQELIEKMLIVMVVSPLIALMKGQSMSLTSKGLVSYSFLPITYCLFLSCILPCQVPHCIICVVN